MIDYKLKFDCHNCGKHFIHYVMNRGFKVLCDETYIVVHESNRHTVCSYCDELMAQKQWRYGTNGCIYIKVPSLS